MTGARVRRKVAKRFIENAVTLAVILEVARPSFFALSPRNQKECVRFKAREVERHMPEPLVSKRAAKRVARAHCHSIVTPESP